MHAKGFLTDSYQVSLDIDGFNYVIDRTLEKGGRNEGTSPHGFLLGSIAGCKGIVAKSYLDHNKLAYEKIDVQADSQIKGHPRQETIEINVLITVYGANLTEKDIRYMTTIVKKGCTMANILTAGGENTITVSITAGD